MAAPSYDFDPIHGRGSLTARIRVNIQTTTGTTTTNTEGNLGIDTVFFEIPSIGLRQQLTADTTDPYAIWLGLTRAQVAKIPTSPTAYAVIDESNPNYPCVILQGNIRTTGYSNITVTQ